MNEAKRAYNLLRGYVNREWERVKGLDLLKALEELDGPTAEPPVEEPGTEAKPNEPRTTRIMIPEGMDHKTAARQILAVDETASFDQIRRAFEKMNKRSQPGQFPEGSSEAQQAADLQRRAQWAYAVLTEETPENERRFRLLEIE